MNEQTSTEIQDVIGAASPTRGRRRLVAWLLAVGLLAAGALAVTAGGLRGAVSPMRFQTEAVGRGDLVVTVTATGNLAATNEVSVGSELSGIITRITADYNDTVKAGAPLAYLDDAKYQAAVMKSKAEVASAEAALQEAQAVRIAGEKKLARYRKTRELTDGRLPSLGDIEQAEADLACDVAAVAAAEAAIDKARATLRADETDLKKTVIYAPIDGIVLSRDVEAGQTVAASLSAPELFTLAQDLRRMALQVDVDEADVGQVHDGQSATFTVDAYPERTFSARITQVRFGAETTDGVVTYKAVLQVDNPDLILRPGMTATAEIAVQKVEDALLVPNSALRFVPPVPKAPDSGKRGLLRALLPGPPRHGPAAPNDVSVTPAAPCVWVLEDMRPVPVVVEKIATDGLRTAVAAAGLAAGAPVITTAVTGGK